MISKFFLCRFFKKEVFICCALLFNIFPNLASSQTFDTYSSLRSQFYMPSSIPFDTTLFPESQLTNRIETNFNRANISWYIIDLYLYRGASPIPAEYRSDHISREIGIYELYDNDDSRYLNSLTLNLAFYPEERAAYNFDVNANQYSFGIDANGLLMEPQTRWGGIQKALLVNYYELDQYKYLGFWLMDPFVNNPESKGGDIYFNLGHISEDIYKDGVMFNENKICSKPSCKYDSTAFGLIGHDNNTNSNYIFSNYLNGYNQDLGFDGLDDEDENVYFSHYLQSIAMKYGIGSVVFNNAINDPAGDNFQAFRRTVYPTWNERIIHEIYKDYKKPQGNSVNSYPEKNSPDYEDLNRNKVFDTLNHYYQIKLSLRPDDLVVGQNFITEKKIVTKSSGNVSPVNFYKFMIPLDTLQWTEVGKGTEKIMTDYFRIFLHGFEESVILRFPEIAFVANDLDHYENIGNKEESAVIYPNPCSGEIIKVMIYNGTLSLAEVYNELGLLVMSQNTNDYGMYLDVSNLKNGIYFVRLITKNKIHNQKIVISKF